LQYGSDELDAPKTPLANLKQIGTVSKYHKTFIKLTIWWMIQRET